jgi:hypothetical protein
VVSGERFLPPMLSPFEKPISEVELYLQLFITTSGGW